MSLDVIRARVVFRDRAFIDVLDLALRFMTVHVRLYARIAAVVLLPAIAVTYAIAWSGGWIAGWITAVLLGFAVQVPFTVLASRVVFQEKVRAREVLRTALRDLPRILVMRVLWLGAVGVAALVFFAPAGWVGTVFGFTNEVMLLERAPIGQSFGRSNRVASSSLSDAMLGLVVALAVPVIGVLLADLGGRQTLAELFQFRPPASLFSEGGSVLALLGWFGVIRFAATARFFVYLNIRTRAEGWDVQTRFAALAARSELAEAA
jgi:hypothetical protein